MACTPNGWEAKTGRLQVRGQPGLNSKGEEGKGKERPYTPDLPPIAMSLASVPGNNYYASTTLFLAFLSPRRDP